ncbi:MAG: hypothetical protein LBG69_01345 [Zoogloeaceae bacterium]|jgi:hypothetical protein|nr:hypothetical protein [Zoogloeaceae bacterium]
MLPEIDWTKPMNTEEMYEKYNIAQNVALWRELNKENLEAMEELKKDDGPDCHTIGEYPYEMVNPVMNEKGEWVAPPGWEPGKPKPRTPYNQE